MGLKRPGGIEGKADLVLKPEDWELGNLDSAPSSATDFLGKSHTVSLFDGSSLKRDNTALCQGVERLTSLFAMMTNILAGGNG